MISRELFRFSKNSCIRKLCKKLQCQSRKLTCLMLSHRNLGRRCDRKIRALKPLDYRISAEATFALLREGHPETRLGSISDPPRSKRKRMGGPRRSGEGQARLGITDVFLRVYYVTHSRFFLFFFPYR